MTIETRIHPYELLIRWTDGVMTGAHYVELVQTVRDGVVISTAPTAPRSIVDAGRLAGEVLGVVQASAVADKLRAEAELALALWRIAVLEAGR